MKKIVMPLICFILCIGNIYAKSSLKLFDMNSAKWINYQSVPKETKVFILMINGMFSNLQLMTDISSALSIDRSVKVIGLSYEDQSVKINAADLISSMDSIGINIPIYIVAHGTGGLIARYATEKLKMKNIQKIVMLGTPNNIIPKGGSVDSIFKIADTRLGQMQMNSLGITLANVDLIKEIMDPSFFEVINENKWPATSYPKYLMIYGNNPVLGKEDLDKFPSKATMLFDAISQSYKHKNIQHDGLIPVLDQDTRYLLSSKFGKSNTTFADYNVNYQLLCTDRNILIKIKSFLD